MKNIKLFNEYVNEAYDGKISDFKYDLEMALEEIGISSKAIKKVSKVGKKFEVRMSSYMSQRSTWEKIGELMGATLVDFKADPKSINVGLYESVEIDEMTKFKAGQKIKWSSPKGPKEDEIEKVDGIYLKLKSGGTIPYQSVITEAIELDDINQLNGFWGTLENSEVKKLEKNVKNIFFKTIDDLVKKYGLSENEALKILNSRLGRKAADQMIDGQADSGLKGLEQYYGNYLKVEIKKILAMKESVDIVNEAKTSLDDMMKWIEKSMKFVKTSKEFNGDDGGIWVSGENEDRYKGKQIYDYYVQDPKNYELGVLKDWEKELNKRGWYSEWYDAGTVMIWPD